VTITVLPSTIVNADVDIDPWVIGVGFRYTF
jgi:outer membrane protein W